ncbi:MAG: hypothetical protein WBG90_03165 [Saonia sp.]
MKTTTYLLILLTFFIANETILGQEAKTVALLVGTWKVRDKEQYEVWEQSENSALKGYGFKIKEHQKVITEQLSIAMEGNTLVYKAMVPDQNEGKTIPFILNSSFKEGLSFENDTHDFPKKIQYIITNDSEIQVKVLGPHDKGFSYVLTRHKPK